LNIANLLGAHEMPQP
jgi:hypothetical protein